MTACEAAATADSGGRGIHEDSEEAARSSTGAGAPAGRRVALALLLPARAGPRAAFRFVSW